MYEKNDDEEKEKKIDLQSINKPDDVWWTNTHIHTEYSQRSNNIAFTICELRNFI